MATGVPPSREKMAPQAPAPILQMEGWWGSGWGEGEEAVELLVQVWGWGGGHGGCG